MKITPVFNASVHSPLFHSKSHLYHNNAEAAGTFELPRLHCFQSRSPWLHVMQLEPVLDPAALWYSREPPVIWAELLLAYTHVNRNGTTDDIFTFLFFFFYFKLAV